MSINRLAGTILSQGMKYKEHEKKRGSQIFTIEKTTFVVLNVDHRKAS